MRLCHPPDGSTSSKYRLLCFMTTKKFCKEKNTLAFNLDRWCHLVLCLRLIPFHCHCEQVAQYTKGYKLIEKLTHLGYEKLLLTHSN